MPVYEIEENGKVYEIEAPSLAHVKNYFGQGLKNTNPAEYDPESPEYQKKYGPTGSNLDNFRAGAGKAYMDLGRGVKQLTGNLSREQVDEIKQRDAPLMSTKAGLAGNITGNVAATLPTMFVPGVNTYAGAALLGGGFGALGPVGTNDSRLSNALMGAAGGMIGKKVGDSISNWASQALARRASNASANALVEGGESSAQAGLKGSVNVSARSRPDFGYVGDDVSAGLNKPMRQIMDRGREMGFKATPGQASGSRALQQLEAKLESQPMTSGPFNAIKENNARLLATKAADAIGVKSSTLDSATLDKAFTRLSGIFDDAADDVPRAINPQEFLSKYGAVQQELRGVSKGFGNHELVNDLVDMAREGTATGKQLQTLTSKLGKSAYKEMTSQAGDRELGMGLYQMKDYVDDLLQQGMDGKRLSRFSEARQQYRTLMMLTSRTGAINPSTGIPNARSIASILQGKDKLGFMRGRNKSDFYDAVRFAQAFQSIVGDSGTATRTPMQGLDFVARVPYAIAAKAYTSSPSVSLAANAGQATQAASQGLAKASGVAPFYAPFLLPGVGGVLGSTLANR
jgi:hypothetical protein